MYGKNYNIVKPPINNKLIKKKKSTKLISPPAPQKWEEMRSRPKMEGAVAFQPSQKDGGGRQRTITDAQLQAVLGANMRIHSSSK